VLALTLPTTVGFTKKKISSGRVSSPKASSEAKTSTPAFDSQLRVLAMQLAQNCSPKHNHNHNQRRTPTSSSIIQQLITFLQLHHKIPETELSGSINNSSYHIPPRTTLVPGWDFIEEALWFLTNIGNRA